MSRCQLKSANGSLLSRWRFKVAFESLVNRNFGRRTHADHRDLYHIRNMIILDDYVRLHCVLYWTVFMKCWLVTDMVSSEKIGYRFKRLVLVKMNLFESLTKSRCWTSRKYVFNGFLVKTCVNSIKLPTLHHRLIWYPQNRIVRK